MKKEILELLEKVKHKSEDDTVYLEYHPDCSGALFIWNEEVFSFDNDDELVRMLKDYIKK